MATALAQVGDGLRSFKDLRAAVIGRRLSITDATRAYNAVVDNLLRLRDSAAALAAEPDIGQRMRAAAAIARQKEHVSQERLVMLQGYGAGALNANLKNELIGARARRVGTLETFASVATQAEKQQFDEMVAGPPLGRTATAYEGWVIGTMTADGSLSSAPFTIDTWDEALLGYGRLIRGLEEPARQRGRRHRERHSRRRTPRPARPDRCSGRDSAAGPAGRLAGRPVDDPTPGPAPRRRPASRSDRPGPTVGNDPIRRRRQRPRLGGGGDDAVRGATPRPSTWWNAGAGAAWCPSDHLERAAA